MVCVISFVGPEVGEAEAGSDESVGDGLPESSVGDGLPESVDDGLLESSVGDGLSPSSVGVGLDESSVGDGLSPSSVGVGLDESSVGEGLESVGDEVSVLEDSTVLDDDGALDVAEAVVEADDDAELVEDADALDIIALAWAGEIVKVDVPCIVCPDPPPLPPDEPIRTIFPSTSCWESINAIVGPATSCVVARSRTLLSKG